MMCDKWCNEQTLTTLAGYVPYARTARSILDAYRHYGTEKQADTCKELVSNLIWDSTIPLMADVYSGLSSRLAKNVCNQPACQKFITQAARNVAAGATIGALRSMLRPICDQYSDSLNNVSNSDSCQGNGSSKHCMSEEVKEGVLRGVGWAISKQAWEASALEPNDTAIDRLYNVGSKVMQPYSKLYQRRSIESGIRLAAATLGLIDLPDDDVKSS